MLNLMEVLDLEAHEEFELKKQWWYIAWDWCYVNDPSNLAEDKVCMWMNPWYDSLV